MSSTTAPATLATLRVSKHMVPSHNRLPNSSILKKPLLIYHSVFSKPSAPTIESHLRSVGVVEPQWRYTMYPTSHFHSSTHEVLCVCLGSARLCFGGEENPERVVPVVQAGDVIVLPAGMAHRLLNDTSTHGSRFEMVGSYPKGHHWDMCYGRKGEERLVDGIGSLPWFERDPIYDEQGPVLDAQMKT